MVLGIWLSVGLLVWRDRADSLRATGLLTESLTRVVSERVDGALHGVDLVLQEVTARHLGQGGRDRAALTSFMRTRSVAFFELRNLYIIDADGIVRTSTLDSLLGVDLSRRPYFQDMKAGNGRDRMVVTGPIPSAATGRIGVLAARPIIGRLGTFEGVVVAVLNPGFFNESLSGVMSPDVDRSVIANAAGDVLARLPEMEFDAGKSIRSGPLFTQHLPKSRSGTFIAESTFDGKPRLASYQALDRYPVVVSIGVTVEAALRRWTFSAIVVSVGGVMFTLLVLVIAVLLDRRNRAERRASAALAASEERYRLLVEGQKDIIHRYLPDTTLVAFNKAYAAFFDTDGDALIGKKWLDFVPKEEHAEITEALASMTAKSPTREDRRRVLRPGKPDCWIEWRTTAQFDGQGNLAGYQTIGRDVTDAFLAQQATAEREELYSQIFHRNPAVKLLVDPTTGLIVDANESAAMFYGYPVDTLKGMRITEINTLSPDQVKVEMEAVARQERLFLRFKHRLASGTIRDVEVYSSPFHVGGRAYLSSIVVDVTERNRFEAELASKSQELVRSNADLEQFAYVASHDLRQPLRMVASYVTLLSRSLAGSLTADQEDFIGFAVAGVKRMDALILGVLDYSRVGRGNESREMVDLGEAATDAAANLGLDQPDGEARIEIHGPLPAIMGVKVELVRLFQNLLGNAVKYRHPDRPPRLSVGCRRDGGDWVVWVQDNGIGIDPQYFDRIFMMFQRLHGETEYEGTGIGLSICQKIVRTHGGRLWVESVEGGGEGGGEGSRFLMAFPAVDGVPGLRELVDFS
ncbi:PAS domain-containing sensor histidine kinase [Paramagnetospirillum kuznetsovii]|uniref:histidine kinase n=1 Tax=Paramagnetospirillum kuznetsovii TaxID=2053833 RepID=A0A364P2C2_9PROT|nr:PAS domain-containing sensor histidine kinase [Paramagnetospirillum kuznetsovii]